MKKTARKTNVISKTSLLYLRRRYWFLYLYSPRAQRDLRHLALFGYKKPRRRKLVRLFLRSVDEFDQKQTANLKKFYKRSKVAHWAVVFIVISASFVAIQLVYPRDRALPLARLQANGYMGFSGQDKISTRLQDFDRRQVSVHTHNKELISTYTDLGVRINVDRTFKDMSSYSLSERLIPFSILFFGNKTFAVDRKLDQPQLELFVSDVVAERNKKPVDAKLELIGTEVKLAPAKEGFEYKKSELESQILRADLSDQAKIVFSPTVLYPKITTYVANDLAISLRERLDTPLEINAESKSLIIDRQTMAAWLELIPNPDKGNIDISFNQSKIKAHLQPFAVNIDYPATASQTTLLNGFAAGRLPGKSGRSLQVDKLVEQIASIGLASTPSLQANVNHIAPKEIIIRRYSRDNQGLQTLLKYWTENNAGEYSIVVKDLNGRFNAGINQNQHYSAVGIYRLFLASMVYSKISAGSLSGASTTSTGQIVDWCLDKMIYESHSACTDALGDIVGWGASDSFLSAQGFGDTTLVKGASLTTASDSAIWLEKLYGRALTSDGQAGTLLSIMSRQINRSGLPAGVPGIRVDNKAGYYGRLHHDVGLVYHPKGKYIVSVMSHGANFSLIADLSREIEKVFDQ